MENAKPVQAYSVIVIPAHLLPHAIFVAMDTMFLQVAHVAVAHNHYLSA